MVALTFSLATRTTRPDGSRARSTTPLARRLAALTRHPDVYSPNRHWERSQRAENRPLASKDSTDRPPGGRRPHGRAGLGQARARRYETAPRRSAARPAHAVRQSPYAGSRILDPAKREEPGIDVNFVSLSPSSPSGTTTRFGKRRFLNRQ